MKKIILFSVVWLATHLFFQLKAQEQPQSIGKQYFEMGEFYRWGYGLDKKSDTIKAVFAYQKSADLNYPDGIMAMGEMYQEGYGGFKKDLEKGFKLFMDAYKLGSGRACYDIAKSYAYGLGIEVNYEKMIYYLNEGIKIKDHNSLYGMGNMLYKGWGIEQSYPKAIEFFEKAASLGSATSNYYLGICYRNGYGVSKDEQKGKEYLEKASLMCDFARKELKKQTSEIDNAKLMYNEELKTPSNFQKAKHNHNIESFRGKWAGHITLYDWSGQFKIDEKPIELAINTEQDLFEGSGTLNGEPISIKGFNNQYGIIFDSGEFSYIDHFMDKVTFSIKTGSFESYTQDDNLILAGNISLFSITENAPERPAYIILSRKKEEELKEKNAVITILQPMKEQEHQNVNIAKTQDQSVTLGKERLEEVNIIDDLNDAKINSRVWPNPFKDKLSVEYSLKTESEIEIRIVSIDGKLMRTLAKEKRQAGLQTQNFEVLLPNGTYVIQLLTDTQKASHIIVKR